MFFNKFLKFSSLYLFEILTLCIAFPPPPPSNRDYPYEAQSRFLISGYFEKSIPLENTCLVENNWFFVRIRCNLQNPPEERTRPKAKEVRHLSKRKLGPEIPHCPGVAGNNYDESYHPCGKQKNN